MKIQFKSFQFIFGFQGINVFNLLLIFFTLLTMFAVYQSISGAKQKTNSILLPKTQATFGINFEEYDKAVIRMNQQSSTISEQAEPEPKPENPEDLKSVE